MKERYSVNIPVVPVASAAVLETGGSLLEIYAQPHGFGEDPTDRLPAQAQDTRQAQALDDQAVRKQWDRVAAPLRQAGLYQSGCTAASAVRKLELKKPTLAVYQRLNRRAYVDTLRLHLAAARVPADWQTAAGNIEGRSAELGLALVLLLAASQAPHRLVIATGRLGGQPAGTRPEDPDVEVLSVGKLPEKLRLVERLAINKELPRGWDHSDPVWLFTPTTFDNDGEPVAVETLPEVARLQALGVTVIPVKTLGEAAGHLKAKRARWMWQDGACLGGVACLLLVSGAAIWRWPKDVMVTPPALTIDVEDRETNQDLKKLEEVPYVSLNQKLDLKFSLHFGEFRYLLTLDGEGDAYLKPLDSGLTQHTGEIDDVSPKVLTLLMLVSGQSWTNDQQKYLAKTISDLRLKPELPDGVRYRFNLEKCGPISAPPMPDIATVSFRGGPVKFDKNRERPPLPAACGDWALRLLDALRQQAPGKIRLDGQAFQVSKY